VPSRASRFYEIAFGWTVEKWEGPMEYWLVSTGKPSEEGIDGGIGIGEPSMKNGELTLGVESLDDTIPKVTESGGMIVREKSPIPGVGYFVLAGDTEGNVFGLMESDPGAK
jgi:uncharacterized protein